MDEELLEKLRRIRNYASSFEWPDKKLKELSVVGELLNSMELGGQTEYSEPISSSADPPDCVVFDRKGRCVGVEVTELVSAEAIRRNQKGDNIYWDCQPNEVIQVLNSIILKKDGKEFNSGPYAKKILIIFTDELIINAEQEEYRKNIAGQSFGPVKQINEAYLLFSYDGIDRYPFIELCLNRMDILD